jgi:hypothetical protein
VTVGEPEQALLERDASIDRIDQRLCDVIAGGGSLLLLDGPTVLNRRIALVNNSASSAQWPRDLGVASELPSNRQHRRT